MRLLALLVALSFGAPRLAFAEAPSIAKVGLSDADKLFGQASNLAFVLDAADARMDALLSEVAGPLALPATSSLDRSVWNIKQKANGDVRVMMSDARPILMLGASAPADAKSAAGALNEGTQELAVMATDLAALPDQLNGIADRGAALTVDAAALKAAGVDEGKLSGMKRLVSDNVAATRATATRAKTVAARAKSLLDDVGRGISATSEPNVVAPVPAPTAAPAPKPSKEVPTVGAVVAKAWTQFNDAELQAAVDLLAEADLLLPRQTQPVPRSELVELFQVRGLVNLIQGDATAATWSVTQALVIHPGATADPKLGPEYAKLHKAIAKVGVVRKVDVSVQGEGRAYLSGIEVTGGSTVQLGQGQHLLQVEKNGTWQSSVVYVREGFVVAF